MGRMNHFKNSELGWKAKAAERQEAGGGWVINSIKAVCLLSLLLPLGGAQHSRLITVPKKLRFEGASPNRRRLANSGFLHLRSDLRGDLGWEEGRG